MKTKLKHNMFFATPLAFAACVVTSPGWAGAAINSPLLTGTEAAPISAEDVTVETDTTASEAVQLTDTQLETITAGVGWNSRVRVIVPAGRTRGG